MPRPAKKSLTTCLILVGRVGPFERDHSSTAEEGWEDPRVCWHILPGFDSQRAASFDVGQQDAHGLLVDGDGALGVGLGVLDMQAAELAGWLTDGLVDPNGAADRVEIGSAKRKRFAESGASIGAAAALGDRLRLGAAALAGADDDQVMDSLLGPCSRPR